MSKALVIGLGASGVACTQFLIKRGYEVIGTDTRETPPSLERLQTLPAFTFKPLSEAEASLSDVEFVVISPGISPYYSEVAPLISKAQAMQLPWFGEIELFARELELLKNERQYEPIVLAITGTNGKTTTTVLTTKMAEASGKFAVAAGNIGPNAVTELDRYLEEGRLPDVWVLELSSFQLESTQTLSPTAAALLNITQDHLDWHGSMQAYMDAKAHIFKSEKTVRVLNRDDASVMQYANAPHVATFGESVPEGENQWGLVKDDELFWLAYNEDDSIALSKRKVLPGELLQRLMPEEALKIRGRHNTMNALAALALIHAANLPLADAIRALSNYTGEAHRVQYALTVDGVDYIDDSKGTNVGATVAALEGLGATGKKMVVILGGDGKGQDFSPIAQSMALHARGAVLIGRDAPMIEKALAGATYPVQKAQTLPEAVQMCAQMAKKGDYVLLSPACASWDMFRDYAQRSEIFIESARALQKELIFGRMFQFKNPFKSQNTKPEQWGQGRRFGSVSSVDYSLLGTIAALLVIGAIMVYSASISLADSPKYQTSEYHFILRHLIYMGVGIFAGWCVFNVPIDKWERLSYPLAILGIICLFLVFVPGLGKSVNGATRWIGFGPVNLQVSEVVKFVSVLVIAKFTIKRQAYMHSITRALLPVLAYVFFVAGLLAIQPDLGATVVIASIVIGIVFLAGLSWKIIFTLGAFLVGTIISSVVLSPWRTARVFAYLNPWDPENQIGKAYQLTHSLIAFGRGEIFGVGLGASVEKMHYLPEAHTDFILAVIGEECGLLGFTVVLGLFYWLVRSAFEIGRQAVRLDMVYAGLVAQGVGLWIGVQALINIGVAIGVFPTKGLTLPLVSYGGSSLVITLCALALLVRVDYENRLLMRGKRRRE